MEETERPTFQNKSAFLAADRKPQDSLKTRCNRTRCPRASAQLWLLFFGSAEYKDRHYCYLTPVEPFVTVTEVIIVTLHHLVHSRDGIKHDWVRTVGLGGLQADGTFEDQNHPTMFIFFLNASPELG